MKFIVNSFLLISNLTFEENKITRKHFKLLKDTDNHSTNHFQTSNEIKNSLNIFKSPDGKILQFDSFNYYLIKNFKESLKIETKEEFDNKFKTMKKWAGHTFVNKLLRMEKFEKNTSLTQNQEDI